MIKLKVLREETIMYEGPIELIGITGHSIGKTYLTITLNNGTSKHPVYVIKDDVPIEYDETVGVNFIHKSKVMQLPVELNHYWEN